MKTTTRQILIGSAVGVALAAAFTVFGLGPRTVAGSRPLSVQGIAASVADPHLPLSNESSVSEVLALMLKSHTTWTTLQASSRSAYKPGTSEEVVSTETVAFGAGGRGYAEMQLGSVQSLVYVVDGKTATIEDRTKSKYTQFAIPDLAKDLVSGPPAPPEGGAKFIIPHPLARIMAGDAVGYIFSTGLAQAMQGEDVSMTGISQASGRAAVTLEWRLYREGEMQPYELRRFWIDAQTGVVLKAQSFSADTDFTPIIDEFDITSIDYETAIPDSRFVLRLAQDARFVELRDFHTEK